MIWKGFRSRSSSFGSMSTRSRSICLLPTRFISTSGLSTRSLT
ncbi:hypothetical protein LINPERPRIM_LOCUS36907 [Linum perenne]